MYQARYFQGTYGNINGIAQDVGETCSGILSTKSGLLCSRKIKPGTGAIKDHEDKEENTEFILWLNKPVLFSLAKQRLKVAMVAL